MEKNSTSPQKQSQKSKIIISILLVIILIQSVKIYLDYKEKAQVTQQLAVSEQDLSDTKIRLTNIKNELDQKIVEIQELGGNIADLEKAKAEIEKELKLTTQRNAKSMKALKDRLDGYEQLLRQKDEELEKLRSVNKELYTENTTLKTTQNNLNDSIQVLVKNKEDLATKVNVASRLKSENITVKGVNSRGKERDSPFKNRQLQKLKVSFNIAENNIAPIEEKKILIRVIDQNGQVIFDMDRGSGTFILNGKEEFYTTAQNILFDNTKQKMIFFYEKGSEYALGVYTIEIYTDSYKMGSLNFEIE